MSTGNWDDAFITLTRPVGGGRVSSLQVFPSGTAAPKTATGTRGEEHGLMNAVYTDFFGVNALRITFMPTING